MKPIIFTDASCDLPLNFVEENDIPYLGLVYHFKGKDYEDDFGKTISYKEFYDALRAGEMPNTSQINEYKFIKKFNELLIYNRPIIYIGMSSGLSGTLNSAKLAREVVISENKNADITVLDSKCASLGQGLLVYNAVKMRDEGYSAVDIIKWVNNNNNKMNHWFVVEDLNYLKRGGRISAVSAAVGNILDIKPIISITEEGKLKNVANARGKKKAIRYLVEKFEHNVTDYKENTVAISHGDCLEDALHLKDVLIQEFKVKNVLINGLGTGMGSHCGYGMLSLCFIGNSR